MLLQYETLRSFVRNYTVIVLDGQAYLTAGWAGDVEFFWPHNEVSANLKLTVSARMVRAQTLGELK